jgi:hypothetical protein
LKETASWRKQSQGLQKGTKGTKAKKRDTQGEKGTKQRGKA